MTGRLPVIGLMLGDMTGIGPEICARLLADGKYKSGVRVVVIGDARVLELGCRDAGVELEWQTVPAVAAIDWSQDRVPLVDLGNIDPARIRRGEVSPESGRLAGETLEHMIGLALGGGLDFAALTRHSGFFGEMNVIEEFSTFRVTSHVALREAVDMITPERIAAAIELADATLRATGIERPRIAVAALNPHGGESGLFGDEEIRIIRPTVERMRAAGIGCAGPIPSDAIFLKALKGEYDGVVMMYHDQGQIATKLLGFNKGVTVTAGLKTVFTTPAHGTAFDIVGKGRADAGALEHALRIAARLAAARLH